MLAGAGDGDIEFAVYLRRAYLLTHGENVQLIGARNGGGEDDVVALRTLVALYGVNGYGVYICYSLGNFCFAGHNNPDDMSSILFQTRFRITEENGVQVVTNEGFRIIPCSISSQEKVNDFKPTPAESEHSAAIVERLLELNKKLEKNFKSTGVMVVGDYPTEWTTDY